MGWMARTCFCILLCANIFCLKVKFERARIVYVNPKYFEYVYVNVSRYGRRSDYYLNIEYVTKCTFTNNITMIMQFYEFRWNVYKRSMVQFRYKLCDFFEKDLYLGVGAATGLKCPLKPAKYTLMNITEHMENFPSVFPFEKGRANLIFEVTPPK